MNVALLSGHLGRDAETKDFNGRHKVSFSLATSSYRKKEKGTDWHNIVWWVDPGNGMVPYLKKGAAVEIQGEIRPRSYEKDGQKRTIVEVEAFRVGFPPSKRGQSEPAPAPISEPPADSFGDDDIPF